MTEAAAQTSPPKAGLLRRLWPVLVIAAGIAAVFASGAHNYLSLETLRDNRVQLQEFVSSQLALAIGIYFLVYVVFTVLMVPGALWITISGGFLFGLAGGSALTTISATAGATLLFLAARTSIGESLRARAGPFLKKLEAGFQENAFSYLLTIRFIPVVPWPVANIAPALLGAKTRDFIITTAVGVIPGVVAYTWLGAGLGEVFDRGEELNLAGLASSLVPALLALAALSLTPVVLKALRKGKA